MCMRTVCGSSLLEFAAQKLTALLTYTAWVMTQWWRQRWHHDDVFSRALCFEYRMTCHRDVSVTTETFRKRSFRRLNGQNSCHACVTVVTQYVTPHFLVENSAFLRDHCRSSYYCTELLQSLLLKLALFTDCSHTPTTAMCRLDWVNSLGKLMNDPSLIC